MSSSEKLRILVAEHSVINRKIITEIVNATEYGLVVHSASNGQIALEWLEQCDIDVILLDTFLIIEGGSNCIKDIRNEYPHVEIIVMSDKDLEKAPITFEAINSGALDFILKPSGKDLGKWETITKNKLEAVFAQIKVKHYLPQKDNVLSNCPVTNKFAARIINEKVQNKKIQGNVDMVLIASSTGGPMALDIICRLLPAEFKKPVLIIQHMPPEFTNILAATLDKKYLPVVIEGKSGDIVKDGQIIIAPGGFHMIMDDQDEKGKTIKLIESHFVNGVRPSADVLFHSVAKVNKGKNILVVVLTGMGNDGTKGIMELKEACNCHCITQSESSCVVYGMPKCVYDAGLSDEVVHLNDIAFRIYQIAHKEGA